MLFARLVALLALAALPACQGSTPGPAASASAPAQPLAPLVSEGVRIETLARGLQHPWALAFLPDGGFLVTQRVGRLTRLAADGALLADIGGVPEVVAEGQGGLLDVALAPDHADSGRVYLSYAEAGERSVAGTAVARGRLLADRLVDVEVVFRQQPKVAGRQHFGSRLVFDRDGHLFVTLGDRGQRSAAQDLGNHLGTIVRIHPDGSIPADNPYVDHATARAEIWSHGHRNVQGAAINPWTGALWTHEHGPRGGDEINLPQAGANHGWPLATHGINYSGFAIPEAQGKQIAGMQPPHHVWAVSPAISGMAFYDHPRHPAWARSLLVGALAQRALIRLTLDGERIVGEERLLTALAARIRDVRVAPDGQVYVLTDDIDGRLLRLAPQ
ncbi:MAG: PQQ-dependent sugar dehydrogenase [Lysobacteraceae bacterium]